MDLIYNPIYKHLAIPLDMVVNTTPRYLGVVMLGVVTCLVYFFIAYELNQRWMPLLEITKQTPEPDPNNSVVMVYQREPNANTVPSEVSVRRAIDRAFSGRRNFSRSELARFLDNQAILIGREPPRFRSVGTRSSVS